MFKKTSQSLQFVDPIEMTKKGKSDQREMNRVLEVYASRID